MAAGLGYLALPPSVFWAMTPRELAAALGWRAAKSGSEPLTRGDLDHLYARFPDQTSAR